jgi:hypothetical protein
MGDFPHTLNISHVVGWLSYTAVYAMVPFILVILFIILAIVLIVLPTVTAVKGIYWACGVAFKALAVPTFELVIPLTGYLPKLQYMIKDVYQRLEEINNWDGFIVTNVEGKELNDRYGFWWIKTDEDWFDETNPRLARKIGEYEYLADVCAEARAKILAKRELMEKDPEAYAKLEEASEAKKLELIAERIELERIAQFTDLELLKDTEAKWLEANKEELKEWYPVYFMTEEEKMENYIETNGEYIRGLYKEWKENYHDKGIPLFPKKELTNTVPNTVSLTSERKGRLQTLIEAKRFGLSRFGDQRPGMFETSVFDFVIPCSAEFRSIIELYSFVVYILLFIFLGIIGGIIYAIACPRSRVEVVYITVQN